MPNASRPKFSRLVTTPAADNTTSHSILILPVLVFTVTLQPAPDVSTDSTALSVMMSMPAFLYIFSTVLDTSSSSTGKMRGINSTTVTLVPNVL